MLYLYYRCKITNQTVSEADLFEGEYAPVFQTCFQTKQMCYVSDFYAGLSVLKTIMNKSLSLALRL